MALTRAQLLAGNQTQGAVLTGQVQGVSQGSGLTIDNTGVISLNASDPTFNGFVKTNNNSAFNAYIWPNADGVAGYVLQTDGNGVLSWSVSGGVIPWTLKGQLVAGTGVGTSALLNAGANTSFLTADSSTATGLAYTSAISSAALLPRGSGAQRPAAPLVGQVRYNTDNNEFEGYGGNPSAWSPLGQSVPTGGGGDKVFYLNSQTVTADYTIPAGQNAMSAGPVSIAAGVTVTVSPGSSWVVL